MARGALKNVKRSRASGSDKYGKGTSTQATGLQPLDAGGSLGGDLDGADLVGWLNCECFFSLVLVGLLAALPFNLHTNDLLQTKESYVTRAAEFFNEGAFEKAASLYERAVNAEETADGHIFLADSLVRADRAEEAIQHYSRAVEMQSTDQDKVASLVNIGKLQAELGRPELAVQSYQMVLDLQPGVETPEIADAHFQVAVSLLESHRYEEAVAHLETATTIVPALAPAHLLLANAYRDMGMPEKAIVRYKKVIKYRPRDTAGLSALGFAYHELGNFKQALTMYRKALSISPTAPDIQYIVAALQGQQVQPARAPAQYVSALFDLDARRSARAAILAKKGNTWAGAEADRLVAPGEYREVNGLIFKGLAEIMSQLVEEALGLKAGDHWLDVLDLGCGKGAAGRALYPLANWVSGVDLSKLAVEQAKEEGIYDEIKIGDFLVTLKTAIPQSVDIVIACDSLPYVGDLKELFYNVVQVLRPRGLFVFNADVLVSDKSDDGTSFEPNFMGRWAHVPSYIRAISSEIGLVLKKVVPVTGETHFKQNGSSLIQRLDTMYTLKSNIYVYQLED